MCGASTQEETDACTPNAVPLLTRPRPPFLHFMSLVPWNHFVKELGPVTNHSNIILSCIYCDNLYIDTGKPTVPRLGRIFRLE